MLGPIKRNSSPWLSSGYAHTVITSIAPTESLEVIQFGESTPGFAMPWSKALFWRWISGNGRDIGTAMDTKGEYNWLVVWKKASAQIPTSTAGGWFIPKFERFAYIAPWIIATTGTDMSLCTIFLPRNGPNWKKAAQFPWLWMGFCSQMSWS